MTLSFLGYLFPTIQAAPQGGSHLFIFQLENQKEAINFLWL